MITQQSLTSSVAYIPASICACVPWLSRSARTEHGLLSASLVLGESLGSVRRLQFGLSSPLAIACNALVWWSWLVRSACFSRVDDIDILGKMVYDIDTLQDKKTPAQTGAFIKISHH